MDIDIFKCPSVSLNIIILVEKHAARHLQSPVFMSQVSVNRSVATSKDAEIKDMHEEGL